MATTPHVKKAPIRVEIGLPEGKDWSAKHLADIKGFIESESKKRSPGDRLITRLRGIRYKMEEYLENQEDNAKNMYSIEEFLHEYLVALDLSFKKFAISIDTT